MAPDRAATRRTLRNYRADIIRRNLIKKRVLHQQGQHRKRSRHIARNGQHHVPGPVDECCKEGRFDVEVRGQPAKRKEVKEPVYRPAEKHLQNHRERKGRNRVGDENDDARQRVKRLPVPERLRNAQGNANEIGQEKRREPEPERDGDPRLDELPGRAVGIIIAREIHPHFVDNEPVPVLNGDRFVKTELRLKLPAIVFSHLIAPRRRHRRRLAALPHALHPHQPHLHRPAWQKPRQRKAHDGDSHKSRNHQQQPSN